MSVLKNLDINLSQSSKKTLFNFLALYIFFTLVIMSLGIYMYYSAQKEIQYQSQLNTLNEYANNLTVTLKELNEDRTGKLIYPWDEKFKTMLYDKRYKLLYATNDNPINDLTKLEIDKNMIVRYLKHRKDYYLGAQYIVVQMDEDSIFEKSLVEKIFVYGVLFLFFMIIIGYFLLQLLLKPMKDTLYLLDRFIKDTTHELNTPISTILTNVELLQTKEQDKFSQKVTSRIEIGAKTISNIYDDLTFLILKHKLQNHNEKINLQELLDERITYFSTLASIKKITIEKEYIDEVELFIDRKKISKVIDNLLSNAIKYNVANGNITIRLENNRLGIKDSGIGIEAKNLQKLFTRYSRFTDTSGGFGIGLHIIKSILDEYGYEIKVDSKIDEFTEFFILFDI